MDQPVSNDAKVLAYLLKIYRGDPPEDLSARLFFERFERSAGLVERDLMAAEIKRLNEPIELKNQLQEVPPLEAEPEVAIAPA